MFLSFTCGKCRSWCWVCGLFSGHQARYEGCPWWEAFWGLLGGCQEGRFVSPTAQTVVPSLGIVVSSQLSRVKRVAKAWMNTSSKGRVHVWRTFIHGRVHTIMHACMHTDTCTYTHTCTHIHAHINTHTCKCIHAYTHTCMHCMYKDMHAQKHSCMHTCTHAHTRRETPPDVASFVCPSHSANTRWTLSRLDPVFICHFLWEQYRRD